jgi:4'-phosphopantetheinyl transferase
VDPAEVHVWRACLDLPARCVDDLEQTLNEEERARARRFSFEDGRRRFVVCRGLLRKLLGGYTGLAPERVEFSYGLHGKPALGQQRGPRTLRFNVSHSKDLALYAITAGREVGVDVECIRPDLASLEVAERFFSRGEVAALRASPPRDRARAFFECWTRKEAYIKARGEGLSLPLHYFQVSIGPGAAALLDVTDDPEEVSRWTLHALDPGEGFTAALAAEGRGWRLRLRVLAAH